MKNKSIFSDQYKCCKPTDIFMAEFVGGVSMINYISLKFFFLESQHPLKISFAHHAYMKEHNSCVIHAILAYYTHYLIPLQFSVHESFVE